MQTTLLKYTRRLLLALTIIWISGCRDSAPLNEETAADIVHTIQEQGISVTLSLSPGIIDPREDALLTIATRFPSGLHLAFPEPTAALEGFTVAAILSPPDTRDLDGLLVRETSLRLTPVPGSNYRIAPMLFGIQAEANDDVRYLITPAIRPPTRRMPEATGTILSTSPEPLYIPPTPAEVMRWTALAITIIMLLATAYFVATTLRRRIQILRMSPTERARFELDRLLAQNLPEQGKYKEFYFAITGIIRTYIERQHGIRAPELTTPEFLAAAAQRPAFKPVVVERLKQFLESADLVKFAAWMPTQSAIEATIHTARDYLAEDEPHPDQGGN